MKDNQKAFIYALIEAEVSPKYLDTLQMINSIMFTPFYLIKKGIKNKALWKKIAQTTVGKIEAIDGFKPLH